MPSCTKLMATRIIIAPVDALISRRFASIHVFSSKRYIDNYLISISIYLYIYIYYTYLCMYIYIYMYILYIHIILYTYIHIKYIIYTIYTHTHPCPVYCLWSQSESPRALPCELDAPEMLHWRAVSATVNGGGVV